MSFSFPKWLALALMTIGCLSAGESTFAATNEFITAPGLVIRAWGTEKGLPQNSINAITQTSDGYLWLGTQEGLARFDGARFTVFGLQDGLPSVEVHAICEDSAGTLWIGTSGGLSRLIAGRIENVSLPARLNTVVTTLKEDSEGRLWIGTRNGLCIYQNRNFIDDQNLASLSPVNIQDLVQDHDGHMWIAGEARGLLEFHDHTFTPIVGPPDHKQILAHCLLVDQASNLWISIGNGIVLRRDKNFEWTTYTESNGVPFAYVSCLTQEVDGTIWAGSLDAGLYRFDAGNFTAVPKEAGLSANDIRSLCPDREGNLWVGTRTGGLDRLSRSKLMAYGTAQGLTYDYTRGMAEAADGTLWVGTIGGGLYQGVAGRFTKTPEEDQVGNFYFAFVDSVLTTADGSLWYGARHGLIRLQGKKLISYSTQEPWMQFTTISALCDDQHGGIWIGTTDSRLVHFQNDKFVQFPNHVARGTITSLVQETNGQLWIGSEAGGLKRIQPAGNEVLSITNGLLSQSIRTLHLDDDGTLWIGTLGGGLSRYRDGKIATFTTSQGLWSDTISQIVPDDNDNLWCGCTRGIFRVSKKELDQLASGKINFVHPRVFGLNDGMLAEECSSGFCPAGLKTKSGLIGFSTVKGLIFVDPNSHMKTLPRDALMEEITMAKGQSYRVEKPAAWPVGNYQSPRTLVIPPGAWELEFHYTAISLSSPESVLFRYQLVGLDKAWIEAGARRTAYYHSLPPGNYTFQVTACNADGIWGDQKATVNITVQPYFWQTLTFQIIAASGGIALIAWIVRSRYRHRLVRLEMQHAVEKERVRIAKDIHDDIGGILTQVSQISDLGLGQSETHNQPTLKGQFERIGQQSRAAVQALDEIVWATNPKNDNLSRFAEYASRFADEYFENSSIRCWQEVPTDLPDLPLRSNVRHNVFLAIKEAFTNILKHSGADEVWLRITLEDTTVRIEVEDNGRGFIRDLIDDGGNGLGNMKSRLEECHGKTELLKATPQGTKIRFTFPLPKAE